MIARKKMVDALVSFSRTFVAGAFDGETPVVAALVRERRQDRGQRTIEPLDIDLPQRPAHGGTLRG